jgi:hypothetical protein
MMSVHNHWHPWYPIWIQQSIRKASFKQSEKQLDVVEGLQMPRKK